MIKVLIAVSGLGDGGIASMLKLYAAYIDKSRFHLDLLVYRNQDMANQAFFEEQGCRIFVIPDPGKHYFQARKEFLALQKREHYDVLHACNFFNSGFLVQLAVSAGIRCRVVHSHASHSYLSGFIYRTYENLMSFLIRRHSTDRIACSTRAGNYLFRGQDFVFLPNAVDSRKFVFSEESRKQIRNRYGIEEGTVVIGTAAMISAVKNQSFLLQVLRQLDERYVFMLAGDGDQREQLTRQIMELSLEDRVIITGWVKNTAPYYSAFDVFVLPSFSEGFPVSALEAQSAGLPCLLSDRVTDEADVSEKTIHLSIDDPSVWADAILGLKPEERINTVEHTVCDIRENISLLEDIYSGAAA